MLHMFLKTSKNIHNIKIVFLLPGHTYMPVDAVHATIERFISKRIVWAPSEWATLIANARVNLRPFEVNPMKYFDFKDWKSVTQSILPNNVTKTREGRKFQVSQLKSAHLAKGDNSIKIKYTYSESGEEFVLPMSNENSQNRKGSIHHYVYA